MEGKTSACHNATVHEKDGKTICDVCAHECEVVADSATGAEATGATGPAEGGAEASTEGATGPGEAGQEAAATGEGQGATGPSEGGGQE